VRLYSRKAVDWTAWLPAIAKGAALLKAKSFTLDGEAVVIGPEGLTDFEALRRTPLSKYPPAKPGALIGEPLEAALRGR
jgi:ATP-dependent DNA ligase